MNLCPRNNRAYPAQEPFRARSLSERVKAANNSYCDSYEHASITKEFLIREIPINSSYSCPSLPLLMLRTIMSLERKQA
jgi:hypothetical protein